MPKSRCKDIHGGTCTQLVTSPDYWCKFPGHNRGRVWVHGKAAASLQRMAKHGGGPYDNGSIKAGIRGERAVERFLISIFEKDPSVHIFSDRSVPGFSINIDFVVVKGHSVLLVDAKYWGAGTYWSFPGNGVLHKGANPLHVFEPASHRGNTGRWRPNRTMEMATERYGTDLAGQGLKDIQGLILISPPSRKAESWRGYKMRHARSGKWPVLVIGNPRTGSMLQKWATKQPPEDQDDILNYFNTKAR